MNYSSFKSEVNDRIGNSYFTDNNSNEILRATNHALRDINIGKVAGNAQQQIPQRRVAYRFQREETDLTYLSGTVKYTLSTYISDVTRIKWIDGILVDSDENASFTKRTPEYFRRRRGINSSIERNFAEEDLNGTRYLLIYHSASDTLNIIWYSNYLVKLGSARALYLPTSNADSYEFLIPDEYIDALIDLTCAYLYMQDRNEQSTSFNIFFNSGRATLQAMMNTIGVREKKPVNQLRMKSDWGINDNN